MAAIPDAQLSAISASIVDLAKRVADLAESLEVAGSSDGASALFEVERSLQMATRSMDRARRAAAR